MYSSSSTLSSRVVFTIFVLLICRIGSFIPVAGIDANVLEFLSAQNQSGILGILNALSGGSLGRMSIFALAIMPYITSSIIMQLISVAYKPFENLKKDGESGRRKINQYSRYLTVILAAFQGYGVAMGLENVTTPLGSVVVTATGIFFRTITVITLVVGTMLLMWLGEQITSRGIGSGTSLIIFVGIVSGIPSAIVNMFELSRKGGVSSIALFLLCTSVAFIITLIVFFEKAQRRVLVQYPKRQVGNRMYGGDVTHMPLKLNTSGVIPPIFASSILLFPATITNLSNSDDGIASFFSYYLGHGKPLYVLCYVVLIVFFSFFYTAVVFNSEETSENLRKYGAYIPGRRPGKNTAEYFDYLLVRLTVLGSVYLSFVCIIPELLMNKYSVSMSLSGTSFLIVVNVVLDTFTQIQTYLFNNKYDSMIKKIKLKNKG